MAASQVATIDYFYTHRIIFWSARTNFLTLTPPLDPFFFNLPTIFLCFLFISVSSCLLPFTSICFFSHLNRFNLLEYIYNNFNTHTLHIHLLPHAISLQSFILSGNVCYSQHLNLIFIMWFYPCIMSSSFLCCFLCLQLCQRLASASHCLIHAFLCKYTYTALSPA